MKKKLLLLILFTVTPGINAAQQIKILNNSQSTKQVAFNMVIRPIPQLPVTLKKGVGEWVIVSLVGPGETALIQTGNPTTVNRQTLFIDTTNSNAWICGAPNEDLQKATPQKLTSAITIS